MKITRYALKVLLVYNDKYHGPAINDFEYEVGKSYKDKKHLFGFYCLDPDTIYLDKNESHKESNYQNWFWYYKENTHNKYVVALVEIGGHIKYDAGCYISASEIKIVRIYNGIDTHPQLLQLISKINKKYRTIYRNNFSEYIKGGKFIK